MPAEIEVTITENTVEVVRTENTVEVTAPGPQGAAGGGGDHGTLTGLADDDHAQYVHLNPANGSRNSIAAPADEYGMVFTVDPAQSVLTSVLTILNQSGQPRVEFRIDAAGAGEHLLHGKTITSQLLLPTNASSPVNGVHLTAAGVTSALWTFQFPNAAPGAAGMVMASAGAGSPVAAAWVDHGGIGGLADDDHTQYYNQARGDARYSQLGHTHNAAGSNTQVQYNSGGVFTGSSDFTFDNTGKIVQVGSAATKGFIALRHRGEARFYEDNANGSNYVALYAPASLTSNHGYVWPTTLPSGIPFTPGLYVLSGFESAGIVTLSWATITGQALTEYTNNEVPTGTINGSNATFLVNGGASVFVDTLRLYKNGIRQTPGSGNDYTFDEAIGTIVFEAGNIPQTGDTLLADYKPEGFV